MGKNIGTVTMTRVVLAMLMLLSVNTAWSKPKNNRRVDPDDLKVNRRKMESDKDLKRNVKTYRGAVMVDNIPMVDQGKRAYCAVAVVKRLLSYYGGGGHVSTNDLASAMNSDPSHGTNVNYMVRALEKYSRQLRLNYREVYSATKTVRDVRDMLKDYNEFAPPPKRIDLPSEAEIIEYGLVPYLRQLDYQSWRTARNKRSPRSRSLCWDTIKRNIDQGIPVVWCVNLGLYRELGTQQKPGGHMRLIIGYNKEKDTILYSDTWGKAHARKEMPWKDAFAITTHIMILSPDN